MRWFKEWLREKLLDTEEDVRYIQAEKISVGKLPEQKLEFWQSLESWYNMPEGRAFQALMQREYQGIHAALLTAKTQEEQNRLLAQMQQQNRIISYDAFLEQKVKAWDKKVRQEGRVA